MENENNEFKLNTAFLGYNKKQTDFEVDRLKTRIKILEGDVKHLKTNFKKDCNKKN